MRAFELGGAGGLDSIRLADRPVPVLGPHDILIRIRSVALNYSDLSVLRGAYSRSTPAGMVLGSDGAGEIVELGSKVTRVAKGDRVAPIFMPKWIDGPLTEAATREARGRTIDGTLAEFVAVDADAVVKVPPHLTDEEASTLPTAGLTAWNAVVNHGELQAGESVLTLGTGGVSMFSMQFALAIGATAFATSGSPWKIERLLTMGVSEAIDYRANPEWGKRIREITETGIDHVVEVGGAGTLGQSLRAVRVGGKVSLVGALSGPGEMNPIAIVMKAINVQGIYVGSRAMFESMNEFIESRGLRPVVDRVFGFSEAPEALRYLESGRHFGKVCIRLD